MIEQLLPGSVRVAESFGERLDVTLYPEEAAVVAGAIERRRREFATVRGCARDALAGLGLAPAPILPGERGAPGWPPGVVGSMTHCEGYRAAVAARAGELASVGIDAEPDAPLPEGIFAQISVPEDLAGVAAAARTGVSADRLLFSAKESVYKAWFPLARRWLGFDQAGVALHPDGSFTVRLLVDGTVDGRVLRELDGRWVAAHGLVATAVTVAPR